MSEQQIQALEKQIMEMTAQLRALRRDLPGKPVSNYQFETLEGTVTLRQLFAGHERLLAIHNMGQGCRYCTLWGDGLNPFVSHLESEMSVVMLSKDSPEQQRHFANDRQWRMRMASHGGGEYMENEVGIPGVKNMPGAVIYELRDGQVYRKAKTLFGPTDLHCSLWHFLGLAGIEPDQWTPQYSYWRRPATLDDGGENVLC